MSDRQIVISSGEPAGIGPDIVIQALQHPISGRLAVTGDPDLIHKRASQLGIDMEISLIDSRSSIDSHEPGRIQVIPVALSAPVTAGELNPDNSQYVIDCIDKAVDMCLDKRFAAMVTAPVHKGVINDGGIRFSGHTEWIAERTRSAQPVMMLASDSLRVCLATTHLPLHQVPQNITRHGIEAVIEVMNSGISTLYGIPDPVIGVCGLNPHAGEGGHLGTEETTIIEPVLNRLRHKGLNLIGPLPADTAFTQHVLSTLDGVLAMYHDQGLPVIKHSGFGTVVNVTLGLPIIRTSVDHGTALDLAGLGRASETSLLCAINLALKFVGQALTTSR